MRRGKRPAGYQRWLLLAALTLLISAGMVRSPDFSDAFTVHDDPEKTLDYCVSQAPNGVSITQAKTALENVVIPTWDGVPGVDQSSVFNLDLLTACSGQDIEITKGDLAQSTWASTSSTKIKFNTDHNWTTSSNPGPTEASYTGVLMHEVGHTLNYGHSGNYWWNVDGNQGTIRDPTMDSVVSLQNTKYQATLENADVSLVPWSEGDSIGDWWNYSPGFEDGFGPWETGGSASISTVSYSGSKSVLLNSFGSVVKQRVMYDGIKSGCQTCPTNYPGMEITPEPRLYTKYRDSGNTSGGIQLRYKWRTYDYNTSAISKTFEGRESWSPIESPVICNASNQDWKSCFFTINSLPILSVAGDDNAIAMKIYFRSKANSPIRVDKTGILDW